MPVTEKTHVYHSRSDAATDVQTEVIETRGTRPLKPGKTFKFKSAYVPFGGESYQAKGRGSVVSPESIRLVFTNPHADTDQKVEQVYTGEEINKARIVIGTGRTLFKRNLKETIVRFDSPSKPTPTKI